MQSLLSPSGMRASIGERHCAVAPTRLITPDVRVLDLNAESFRNWATLRGPFARGELDLKKVIHTTKQ